ncbi:hypothetical protein HY500_01245 [Candidatus Woesearchaeota archaeon]|nr:hypothetical protein [Candidatus Woesearchaeota archaeon]
MHKHLFLILAITALLVVAGCGSKEVSTADSGSTTEKQAADSAIASEIDDEELSSLDASELDLLDQDLAVI